MKQWSCTSSPLLPAPATVTVCMGVGDYSKELLEYSPGEDPYVESGLAPGQKMQVITLEHVSIWLHLSNRFLSPWTTLHMYCLQFLVLNTGSFIYTHQKLKLHGRHIYCTQIWLDDMCNANITFPRWFRSGRGQLAIIEAPHTIHTQLEVGSLIAPRNTAMAKMNLSREMWKTPLNMCRHVGTNICWFC